MKVYLDYDSSLNNLMHKWIDWINARSNLNYTIYDVDSWNWVEKIGEKHGFDAFEFFKDNFPYTFAAGACEPLINSIEFVFAVKLLSKHKINILTATHDPKLIKQKDNHIVHFYGNDIGIIHDTEKHEYAICDITDSVSILFDDNPAGCLAWAKAGGYALLFTNNDEYTYAIQKDLHPNIFVIRNYEEALQKMEELMNIHNALEMSLSSIPSTLENSIECDINSNVQEVKKL